MVFKGTLEEYLFVSEIVPERMYMFNKDLKTGLSVIWNIGTKAEFIIDSQPIAVKKDCFLFFVLIIPDIIYNFLFSHFEIIKLFVSWTQENFYF